MVRARIAARSNSANAPNTCSTNLPAALAVSICSASDRSPTPPPVRSSTRRSKFGKGSAQPIEAAHHHSVAIGGRVEELGQRRPMRSYLRGNIGPDVLHTRCAERVDLTLDALIGRRYPCIAQQFTHAGRSTVHHRQNRDGFSGHETRRSQDGAATVSKTFCFDFEAWQGVDQLPVSRSGTSNGTPIPSDRGPTGPNCRRPVRLVR
jgi:hypothetical protein